MSGKEVESFPDRGFIDTSFLDWSKRGGKLHFSYFILIIGPFYAF